MKDALGLLVGGGFLTVILGIPACQALVDAVSQAKERQIIAEATARQMDAATAALKLDTFMSGLLVFLLFAAAALAVLAALAAVSGLIFVLFRLAMEHLSEAKASREIAKPRRQHPVEATVRPLSAYLEEGRRRQVENVALPQYDDPLVIVLHRE